MEYVSFVLWFDLGVHRAEYVFYCFANLLFRFGKVDFSFYVNGYFFHFCSTFSRVCRTFCLVVSGVPSFMIMFSAMAIAFPRPTVSSLMSLSWKACQFFGSSGLALFRRRLKRVLGDACKAISVNFGKWFWNSATSSRLRIPSMRILGFVVAAIFGRQRLAIVAGPSFCLSSSIVCPVFSGVSVSPRFLVSSRMMSPMMIIS